MWRYKCDKHLQIRCVEYLSCTLPYKVNVVISRLKMHKSVDMTVFMNESCVTNHKYYSSHTYITILQIVLIVVISFILLDSKFAVMEPSFYVFVLPSFSNISEQILKLIFMYFLVSLKYEFFKR